MKPLNKDTVSRILIRAYKYLGMKPPHNHNQIVAYCMDHVLLKEGTEDHWSSDDILEALTEFMESRGKTKSCLTIIAATCERALALHFAADVYIDNEHVMKIPLSPANRDNYIEHIFDLLIKGGILTGVERSDDGVRESFNRYCLRNNIKLLTHSWRTTYRRLNEIATRHA